MGYKLQRGTNGEEGYYRLSLDLPLTAHEVREIANQAIEEGWSFGDELREEIEALEADAKWTAFVHFLPPSEHDLIWRADGPFAPVTPGPHYTAAKPRYPFCDGKGERLMDTAALDLSGLTEHGDILELDDSRRLRLLIEPDDISPMEHINDCDAYGKVAWVERSRAPRPEGFDGSACKLWTATSDQFWWQPYRDGKDIADTPEERQLIRDLMTWGFSYVAVVLEGRCDFDHWHEVNRHGVGGCDSVYPELISDLVDEVLG